MAISVRCPNCEKTLTLDDKYAGKRGKCKSCGSPIQVPEADRLADLHASSPSDLYGLDDEPMPAASRQVAAEVEESDVPPSSVRGGGRRKKTASGEPWGLGVRRSGYMVVYGGLMIFWFARAIPPEWRTNPATAIFLMLVVLGVLLGALITVFSVVGAAVSFSKGNARAFRSESTGDMFSWVGAILLSAYFIGAFVYGLTNPKSKLIPPFRPRADQAQIAPGEPKEVAEARQKMEQMQREAQERMRPPGFPPGVPGPGPRFPRGPIGPRGAPGRP